MRGPGLKPFYLIMLASGESSIGLGKLALLSAVVLVAALYAGKGVSAISKALVPQPSIGQIEIMK